MLEGIRGLGQKQKERIVGVGAFAVILCRVIVPSPSNSKKPCFVICVTEGKAPSG